MGPRSARAPLAFAVAMTAVVVLTGRLLVRERDAATEALRADLVARARELAREVEATAGPLVIEAAESPDVRLDASGAALEPPRPRALTPLELDPHADPEGAFFLARAEEAERGEGGAARARELYAAAASADRDPGCRALALHRLVAVERRAGDGAAIARANRAFLDALPAEAAPSREALLARVAEVSARGVERPIDDGMGRADVRAHLARDLAVHLGSGEDAAVLALLDQLGDEGRAARRAREHELAALARMESLPPLPRSPRGAVVHDGRVVAWFRAPGGELWLAESGADVVGQVSGEGEATPVELVIAHSVPGEDAGMVEVAPLGPLFAGQVAVASVSQGVVASVRSRALGRISVIVIPLGAAILLALVTTWRAVRREREATELRGSFVAKVGHDLRTPLAVMRMYAETLVEGRARSEEEREEFARTILSEAESLSGLVSDALDLERLDAGRVAAGGAVELVALVRGLADLHGPLCEESGVALQLDLPDAPCRVRGEESSLRGAIANLLENGRVHGVRDGAGELEVAVGEGENDVVVLTVRDRGPGWPEGGAEGLFERFARGPGVRGRGAGLGLAVVRGVVEAAGGRVVAGDREGGGAEVRVELRRTEAPRGSDAGTNSGHIAPAGGEERDGDE